MPKKGHKQKSGHPWKQDNPFSEVASANMMGLTPYRMTVKDYNRLFTEQNGVCAICGIKPTLERRLAVDHSHTTNKIRGLLCTLCNSGLGMFKDNIDLLARAISYLKD